MNATILRGTDCRAATVNETRAGAAVFDFDRTLIHQGSLAPVLCALVGNLPYLSAACSAAAAALQGKGRRSDTFRIRVLQATVKGKTLGQLAAATERASTRLRWRSSMLEAYHRHRDAGHRIVVASGGLAFCVGMLLELKGLRVDDILGTELMVRDDVLTGEIDGHACVGREKARRVEAWIGDPDAEVWGYGNLPQDRAMLALSHHPVNIPAYWTSPRTKPLGRSL